METKMKAACFKSMFLLLSLFFFSSTGFSQGIPSGKVQITGTVSDQAEEPIIGANVMEKGTPNASKSAQ